MSVHLKEHGSSGMKFPAFNVRWFGCHSSHRLRKPESTEPSNPEFIINVNSVRYHGSGFGERPWKWARMQFPAYSPKVQKPLYITIHDYYLLLSNKAIQRDTVVFLVEAL